MEIPQRKANPSLIFRVWESIREISDANSAEYDKIAEELFRTANLSNSDAKALVNDMVHDGFLNVTKPARKSEKIVYSIPEKFNNMVNINVFLNVEFFFIEMHIL